MSKCGHKKTSRRHFFNCRRTEQSESHPSHTASQPRGRVRNQSSVVHFLFPTDWCSHGHLRLHLNITSIYFKLLVSVNLCLFLAFCSPSKKILYGHFYSLQFHMWSNFCTLVVNTQKVERPQDVSHKFVTSSQCCLRG